MDVSPGAWQSLKVNKQPHDRPDPRAGQDPEGCARQVCQGPRGTGEGGLGSPWSPLVRQPPSAPPRSPAGETCSAASPKAIPVP